MISTTYDLIIVGSGAAGLAAALSALERKHERGSSARIALLERSDAAERGGNTRYSQANMRLEAVDRLAPGFVEDMLAVSAGRSDRRIIERLAREAVPTLAWLQRYGVTFHRPLTYFLTAAAPRIQPMGGGAAIVEQLATALGRQIPTLFGIAAERLVLDDHGAIAGLEARDADGRRLSLRGRAIILACGGYEASRELLAETIGAKAAELRFIARGTRFNRGEGIRMAPEAVVLVYPYGIVVNRLGKRFFDEGAGRVDETWETLARTIAFEQDGAVAYAIFDQRLFTIEGYERAIKSEIPPYRADSIAALAGALQIDPTALDATIASYNAAAAGDETAFDPTRTDGLKTIGPLDPPKSNWARPIDRPPFLAYPLACAIAYTFGGIATNDDAEVLRSDGTPLHGLYAAGEINGLFFHRAPGGTSVLRALVFGRIAGHKAIDYLNA